MAALHFPCQPGRELQGLDAVIGRLQARLEGQDELIIVVAYLLQGRELAAAHILAHHGFRDLHIQLLTGLDGDEVHLRLVHLADRHVVAAAQELKVHHVFQRVPAVALPEAQQIIPQSYIDDVILAECSEKPLPLMSKRFIS